MACSLFGMSAIGRFHCNDKNMKTRKIIPYRTILITGLWLVRKVNISLWVYKTGKMYLFHSCQTHLSFCCLHFFQTQDFLTFYSLNIFIVRKGVSAPSSWYSPFLKKKDPHPPPPTFWQPSLENSRFYDDLMESGRLKTINIKPWKPVAYRNCVS